MGKVAKAVIFGCFKCCVASFRVAGVALCGTWTCQRRVLVVAESCRACGKICKRCHFRLVFSKNRIGTAARSGDQVQISWQAWYFLTRVKIEGSLARNARFDACTCVVLSSWLCRVYGGSCNTLRLRRCQSVKIGGNLARNARFEACTCVVLSFWLCSGCAVSMWEAAKLYV